MESPESNVCTIFVCGDVMIGRGIDQVFSHPGEPTLYESYVRDARDYVALAEERHGPIPRHVSNEYIWGDALAALNSAGVARRIINLETAITSHRSPDMQKGIHYRMHPQNIGCLDAARIDACVLANNHTLDWGMAGLSETLTSLDTCRIARAGAGLNASEAANPAILSLPGKGRLVLFAFGATSSGIPSSWQATSTQPGINVLDDFTEPTAAQLCNRLQQIKQAGDVAIASVHWGDNWVHHLPPAHVSLAHRLIDGGFDLIHGHSSHHPLPVEVYRNRLILYGCGDFINDYEGITGIEEFRSDLAVMYLVTMEQPFRTMRLRMLPFRRRRFQLQHASREDGLWLHNYLKNAGTLRGADIHLDQEGAINIGWGEGSINPIKGPWKIRA